MNTDLKILTAVPTYRRADDVPTLVLFPYGTLFVAKSEIEGYKKNYPDAKVVEHPDTIKGLTPKLNFILQYAIDNKYDGVVKVDDDFNDCVALTPHRYRMTVDETQELLESLFVMCMDANTNLFTFIQTADVRRYEGHRPFRLFSSVRIGIYGVLLKGLETQWFDERFRLKQDMDYAFQTMYKYKKMIVDTRYSFTYKKTMESTGGCSVYRNSESEQESINMLKRKWGQQYFKQSKRLNMPELTVNVTNPMYK